MNGFFQDVQGSFRKYLLWIIALPVILGMQPEDFIGELWSTGSFASASDYWIAHGAPKVPAKLILLAALFVIIIGWDMYQRSMQGGYGERTDGYRARSDD
ncbi:hypothetical protein ACFQ1E_18080 [Sphingomonas canadensis]|uniref:Uncharacterized protein n=1 Tax=Sphingomonas canadensis TaxID=1219257 RepID=A0ABW3HB24_9SPHN|nr:hypothetical protein [Sphingomonas canadensis]MCW3837949.1 hypothetical protein [Sphingomonas canadensis]